jgi:hypothetical protein
MTPARRQRKRPPSRQAVATYWEIGVARGRGDHGFHRDDGEPMCWACGAGDTRFDGQPDAYDCATGLERAHLVAQVVDGSTDVSNIVLLCHRCHRALDRDLGANRDRNAAIAWIRDYHKRWAEAFNSALDSTRGAREREAWFERTMREDDAWRRILAVFLAALDYEATNTDGGMYSPQAAVAALSRAIKTVQRWAKRSLAVESGRSNRDDALDVPPEITELIEASDDAEARRKSRELTEASARSSHGTAAQ